MEHVQWVLDKARERGDQYNIKGIDLRLTKGVLKRVVPAVATTNAIIAGELILSMHLVR